MEVRIESLPDQHDLAIRWRELESRTSHTFFQSWSWIGSWLRALPDTSRIRLLTIVRDDRTAGLGLIAARTIRRRHVVPVATVLLHETGDSALDTLTIEHNGLLLSRQLQGAALNAVMRELDAAGMRCDEFRISGIETGLAKTLESEFSTPGYRLLIDEEKPYFTVNLEGLRERRTDYLASLSSNSRSQIRRSIREYESQGPLSLRIAEGQAEALSFLDELRKLHQAYWRGRGSPGAFATEFSNAFHQNLIAEAVPRGEIQLARIDCGPQPIAYLYNFVHDGVVANYQAGIRYDADARRKPGLVAHHLLIDENLKRGARIYDFLMGDQRYKRSLATDEAHMCRLVVQRNSVKFRLENLAIRAYRMFRPGS